MNDSKLGDLDRQRIEAASTLANCIIDVINEHVSLHGTHDPGLWRLAATLATVAEKYAIRSTKISWPA